MKRKLLSKPFKIIGIIGLVVGCVLLGTTFYQLANFIAFINGSGQSGSFKSAVLNSAYMHYGILLFLSLMLLVLGALLVYRNLKKDKITHRARV